MSKKTILKDVREREREFVIPGIENTQGAEPVEVIEEAQPTTDAAIVFELELGEPGGRCGRRLRIDRHWSVDSAHGAGRVREGLQGTAERLASGRIPDPNSTADFVQLFLEKLADPRVKRVVFLEK